MAELTRPQRARLAKAELLMALASTAERWKRQLVDTDPGTRPVAQWPADDPFVALCRTYQLTPAQLSTLCDKIGDELEHRALRAGYDEHL